MDGDTRAALAVSGFAVVVLAWILALGWMLGYVPPATAPAPAPATAEGCG